MPSASLLLAAALAVLFTLILKTAPLILLKGNSLPTLLRKWLDFVPVSVMAALVGPDVFMQNGILDISFSNLFLLVSIPTSLAAILSKNYFVTIAVGIGLVIAARYYGIA